MEKIMTVHESVTKGDRMNEARDKITKALDDADLSILDRVLVLEILAFEAKAEALS